MPASPSTGKKGRVTRVTRVNVDREVVRVEREGDGHPVADVVDHRQTRTSVTHRNNGKQAAALPSSDHDKEALGAANDASDSQEAEELLSEAEELLHEPILGGKRSVTSRHRDGAGPSRLGEDGAGGSLDAVPDTQHQIEEVHPETVEDEVQAEPHVEEPESSVSGPPERSAPAKSGGIVPRMKGILSSIVHMGQEGDFLNGPHDLTVPHTLAVLSGRLCKSYDANQSKYMPMQLEVPAQMLQTRRKPPARSQALTRYIAVCILS